MVIFANNGYEIADPLMMEWSPDMEDRIEKERRRSHDYLKEILK